MWSRSSKARLRETSPASRPATAATFTHGRPAGGHGYVSHFQGLFNGVRVSRLPRVYFPYFPPLQQRYIVAQGVWPWCWKVVLNKVLGEDKIKVNGHRWCAPWDVFHLCFKPSVVTRITRNLSAYKREARAQSLTQQELMVLGPCVRFLRKCAIEAWKSVWCLSLGRWRPCLKSWKARPLKVNYVHSRGGCR